ncbi:hypothetical protein [Microcoleus sp. D3_18_C2]|uniref:hypothetical protein n=1 Tax=Microcoleus sp. D3_18_C2 TaxID=3055334 RepID=UPI002FCEFF3A
MINRRTKSEFRKYSAEESAFIGGSNLPESPTSVATLKALKEQRDALLYAYIRAHWWYWESSGIWYWAIISQPAT